jgi:hypothetical protein
MGATTANLVFRNMADVIRYPVEAAYIESPVRTQGMPAVNTYRLSTVQSTASSTVRSPACGMSPL